MNNIKINNYRMAAYAALAAGLINLRYQTGHDSNLFKSLILVVPGLALLLTTLTSAGRSALMNKNLTRVLVIVGLGLLAYSFLV
jgi:hypothetical protein